MLRLSFYAPIGYNQSTMAHLLNSDDFIRRSTSAPVIDVRSPGEFQKGHIPGGVNIPLLQDDERAEVGTLYKRSGKDLAVLRGLEIVGPKMSQFVVQAKDALRKFHKQNGAFGETDAQRIGRNHVGVHCWRGGMRSESFAWLLEKAGFEVSLLQGGYKSYRQWVHQQNEREFNLVVLSGLTGAGKTKYLHALQQRGHQIVDLEGLANHRGSAFGAIGLGDQPSTEQFENSLQWELSRLNPEQPIWVEDEGNRIGGVVVPSSFHKQMQCAPAVFVDAPLERRIDHLVEVYGELPLEALIDSIERIRKRLGGQHVNAAIDALQNGDLRKTTEVALRYYDKTYLKAVQAMPRTVTVNLAVDDITDEQVVDRLVDSALHL